MSNEISQIELRDHKGLMEKIRVLCDKLDELFLIYQQLQQAVPDHNADQDAHRDIRELIISLDNREADHYVELSSEITANNTAINNRVDALADTLSSGNSILTAQVDNLDTTVTAIVEGTVTYDNSLNSAVRSRTFLNGNTGAVSLNNTAPAGYNMLLKVKSTNGVFTEGAYNNKYQVSYAADTTISAGLNRVDKTNILIDENGDASFCNDVSIAGDLTATNIRGHVVDKVDAATTADNAVSANKAKALISDTLFNTADTHLLKYSSGQFIGAEGSDDNLSVLSYPNGSTSVNNSGKANIQNIRLLWAGNSKYWHDIFVSPNQRYIWHRDVRGTANAWARIVEESTSTTWNINISGSANAAVSAAEATHAISSDTALQATNATNANHALLADDATHAVNADSAVNSTNASYATRAGNATSADSATTAENATNALNDNLGNPIHSYYVNAVTQQNIAGDKTFINKATFKGDVSVTATNPTVQFNSSLLTKGSNPSVTIDERIVYTDKQNNELANIGYRAGTAGSSVINIECYNNKKTSSGSISFGFDTAASETAILKLNADKVIPIRADAVLGDTANKFANINTSGITLDEDGVGTIKLLARTYTTNAATSAYANIAGSNLYAVAFVTESESESGALVKSSATIVIDKSAPQQGTWQPLQYLSGSWRNAGNTIIGMYRRIA